jgi:hypothetical protein
MLAAKGYSLQAPVKTKEGADHPDRDAQFRYIAGLVEEFRSAGEPVISVDAKKKELVGDFAPSGREWQRVGRPVEVNTYDFPDKEDYSKPQVMEKKNNPRAASNASR